MLETEFAPRCRLPLLRPRWRPIASRCVLLGLGLTACASEDDAGDGEQALTATTTGPASSSAPSTAATPSTPPPSGTGAPTAPAMTSVPVPVDAAPTSSMSSTPVPSASVPDSGDGGAGGTGGGSGADGAPVDGAGGAAGAGTEPETPGAGGQGAASSDDANSSMGGSGGQEGAPEPDPLSFAAGLHELFLHDTCTGPNGEQSDTCLHEQELETPVEFGGDPGTVYSVRLRVRGLFEPTSINGGETPYPEHPYFKVGGTVSAADYSQWHIEVSEPAQTYWLNHYPQTSHTIYQEDFEADIRVAGGATVYVRVVDANDRQIDNGTTQDLPDRQQSIEGVTDGVPDGQVLRLDVVGVEAQQ